jgi:hypothetical protein
MSGVVRRSAFVVRRSSFDVTTVDEAENDPHAA